MRPRRTRLTPTGIHWGPARRTRLQVTTRYLRNDANGVGAVRARAEHQAIQRELWKRRNGAR